MKVSRILLSSTAQQHMGQTGGKQDTVKDRENLDPCDGVARALCRCVLVDSRGKGYVLEEIIMEGVSVLDGCKLASVMHFLACVIDGPGRLLSGEASVVEDRWDVATRRLKELRGITNILEVWVFSHYTPPISRRCTTLLSPVACLFSGN